MRIEGGGEMVSCESRDWSKVRVTVALRWIKQRSIAQNPMTATNPQGPHPQTTGGCDAELAKDRLFTPLSGNYERAGGSLAPVLIIIFY